MQSVLLASAAPLFTLAQAAPAAPPAGADVGQAILQVLRDNAVPLLIAFLVLNVIVVVGYWIASKPVTSDEETGTFGNAVKVYLYYILNGFAVGLGWALALRLLGVTPGVPNPQGLQWRVTILEWGGLLLMVALVFLIPMRVYRIGFARALGFVVLSLILSGVGYWLVLLFMVPMLISPEARKRITDQALLLARTAPPQQAGGLIGELAQRQARDAAYDAQEKVAMDSTRPFGERQAALKQLYAQLEQMRAGVAPADAGARAAYEQRRARYESLLNRVKAEYAAQRGGR